MKKKTKPYWEMNTQELAEATKEFDREFVAEEFREPTPQERDLMQNLLFGNPGLTPREVERKRLNRQCAEILARLRLGPATNADLNMIAYRYSARIRELRQVGYRIEITDRNHETGLNTYELMT